MAIMSAFQAEDGSSILLSRSMEKKRTGKEIKQDIVSFLNLIFEEGVLNLYYAGLISADSLNTVEDCDIAEKSLNEFKDALPETNISEQEKCLERINDGLKIVKREKTLKEGN